MPQQRFRARRYRLCWNRWASLAQAGSWRLCARSCSTSPGILVRRTHDFQNTNDSFSLLITAPPPPPLPPSNPSPFPSAAREIASLIVSVACRIILQRPQLKRGSAPATPSSPQARLPSLNRQASLASAPSNVRRNHLPALQNCNTLRMIHRPRSPPPLPCPRAAARPLRRLLPCSLRTPARPYTRPSTCR